MNPHGTTGAPHCDPVGCLCKTTRPCAGSRGHLGRKGAAAGAPLAHARPEMPRPSVDSHDLPLPTPALRVAAPLYRPGQAAQLLQDTGTPSSSCGDTNVGAVGGFCIQEGKGWSSHTTLPMEAWGTRGWFYSPRGLGTRDPLGDTQDCRNSAGRGGGTGCLGFAAGPLGVPCLRFGSCGSPSLSFVSGKEEQSGWICADPSSPSLGMLRQEELLITTLKPRHLNAKG